MTTVDIPTQIQTKFIDFVYPDQGASGPPKIKDEYREWLRKNCSGMWKLVGEYKPHVKIRGMSEYEGGIVFENEGDAALFILRWL